MRRVSLATLVVAAALTLPGCFSLGGDEAPEIRRHSIDLPDMSAVQQAPDFGPVIVRQFASRARYEPRVVAIDGPGRVVYLDGDRWVEDPAEAVTTVLRESLATSGAFEAVAAATSEMQTDLVLDGSLLACDVLREPAGPWRVRLAVRLEVTDRRTGDMVAAESFDVQHALPGAGTDGLGAAVGRCVDDVVTQALASWRAAQAAADAEAPPASR